ncbi:MAG: motility protein A, partial [Arenimonas sp.]
AVTVADHNGKLVETLRHAAEAAPAMGLIGTLVGLVQMLGRLSDPAAIGPALAVALLTTLYGAVLANMVFAPLAAKLERDTGAELLVNDILRIGVAAIGRGEHPRRIEALIVALLPPALRGTAIG